MLGRLVRYMLPMVVTLFRILSLLLLLLGLLVMTSIFVDELVKRLFEFLILPQVINLVIAPEYLLFLSLVEIEQMIIVVVVVMCRYKLVLVTTANTLE